MSSEDRNVSICESSLPSSLLARFVSTRSVLVRLSIGKCLHMMTSTPSSSSAFLSRHEASFSTTLEEIEKSDLSPFFLESLAAFLFSPNPSVLSIVAHSLYRHASNQEPASMLAQHRIHIDPADRASKPIKFVEQLDEAITNQILSMESLSTDSTTQHNSINESTFHLIGKIWEFVTCGLNLLHQLHNHKKPPLKASPKARINDFWVSITNGHSFCDRLHILSAPHFLQIFVSAVDVGLSATRAILNNTSAPLCNATAKSLHQNLEIVSGGLGILYDRLGSKSFTIGQGLIAGDILPRVKTAITTCLELPSLFTHIPADQKKGLSATINSALSLSWRIIRYSLHKSMPNLSKATESLFAVGPDMFSLLEQTSKHRQTSLLVDLLKYTNKGPSHSHSVFVFLKENMIERVLTRVQPTTVPLTDHEFHDRVLSLISDMTLGLAPPKETTEESPYEPLLQFNRVVVPSQRYLLFVFQRDEFLAKLSTTVPEQINRVLNHIMRLERELHKEGKDVETGRESWEVGWLVEKTDETALGNRLNSFARNDEMMKERQKTRWKQRAERLRQAGVEDTLDAWLTRSGKRRTPTQIVTFIRHVSWEIGSNHGQPAYFW
ncbi:hypothetical protein BLNAU_19404 [Blattamonas nauphoetae]|uniref:Uncharacterized protein n=1 Tax=Blattamonas nauphoetae TaxID=2049346 RepID=A0ABQ9X5S2_9EUKA|nr:hypothetical protein BLNAU_19404 [Blattamonas nauphoetae]